jgi:hypothetical protein
MRWGHAQGATRCLSGGDASISEGFDLRHCVHRRQERHSISAATPSSISTVTASPMIASLVGRFMIKTLHEKGPGLLPGRRPHLVGGP